MTAPPGRAAPDLLVSGDDRPPRRLGPRGRRTAAAVAAVLVAAAAATGVGLDAQADRTERERRRQVAADGEVLRLALLSPGRDGAARYGPSRPGLDVVVGNTGPAPVRLLWATLVPGRWQVQVPAEREVRPGRSVVLSLTPPVACGAPAPRLLRVEVLRAGGRPATAEFAVADTVLADGGRLGDAVAAAALGCDPRVPPADDGRTYPHRS